MVFALKEQNHIIGQLRREANANFMLLDDRSRRTHDIVQKLMGKVGVWLFELIEFSHKLVSNFQPVATILCHARGLSLQPIISPKRFDIFSPCWGVLRRSRCVQIFL